MLGGLRNPAARAILQADAVLDMTGGDSFTDLYGQRRFNDVTLLKRIVLENQVSLVLLPQTYGPFTNPKNRRVAENILRQVRIAWARDERSFVELKRLVGADFDPSRHCSGVDVAFGLEAIEPDASTSESLTKVLRGRRGPIVGINISGLLFNDAQAAARQYSLKADYRQVVIGLVRRLLRETDCNIVLIPHVTTQPGHYESDNTACQSVADCCQDADRISMLPPLCDPRHIKWVISQLEWFCGTRMHSTIAGLSSGVPTAAIAYSLKTQGVFETCGQGAHVADPRILGTDETVESLIGSWRGREEARRTLQTALPMVLRRAEEQMGLILAQCVT
jgi:polysaccharide pyruvyl transferase WcaK-like protein